MPIISQRSHYAIIAMLAVIKAGGAYLPVDVKLPKERILYMLQEAECTLALVHGYDEKLPMDVLDIPQELQIQKNAEPLDNRNCATDTSYVIFTSGSTGKPKGTLLSHRNLVNFCLSENSPSEFHNCVFHNCDNILAIGSFAFDISLIEIFQPLLTGKSICMADEETVNSAKMLAEMIKEHQIDLLHTTPTRLAYYMEDEGFMQAMKYLKVILVAGESLPMELYQKITSATEAVLFNGYGPTETTVGCTFSKMNGKEKVTIGKPIANVQIYVMDKCQRICPVGVAGELMIAGDGVGKGYLNRPELTAEKFVDNPFKPGEKMYRSGDLARWNLEGELEFLGRMDTQVKIRGLRIELGEIENQMCAFDGIQMSVVADKRDENNRQYLVGYYTAEVDIDEKQLRSFLAERLPRYMVPNFFMQLEEIPMTSSGKADRKNLPVPELTRQESLYVAPQNPLQSTLCKILSELLNHEQVGIHDDFFEMGGDSLSAIAYVAEASAKGIEFDLQTVFEKTTVAELSAYLVGKSQNTQSAVIYAREDFDKFQEILAGNQKKEAFVPQYQSLGNILLTGATGYLGAHILDKCMELETGKIYCLVRSESQEEAVSKCRQVLNYYFDGKYDKEIGGRILPVRGDITDEQLSKKLPEDIQTIIHTAATVKHYGAYDEFYRINAGGTKCMLEAAKRRNAKFLYISTVSVGGLCLTEKGSEPVYFDERCLYIGQNLDNVYLRSKFEAERMVLEAKMEGLSAVIFRVGNLSNRYSDLKFQKNYQENAFLRRIKAFVDTGAYPKALAEGSMEFSPVDLTAEVIVKLAEHHADQFSVFHVDHAHKMPLKSMMEQLEDLQWKTKAVDMEDFLYCLSQKKGNVYDAFRNELKEMGRQSGYGKVIYENDFTVWFLEKIGFQWCEITKEYLGRYMEYFEGLGYWEVSQF